MTNWVVNESADLHITLEKRIHLFYSYETFPHIGRVRRCYATIRLHFRSSNCAPHCVSNTTIDLQPRCVYHYHEIVIVFRLRPNDWDPSWRNRPIRPCPHYHSDHRLIAYATTWLPRNRLDHCTIWYRRISVRDRLHPNIDSDAVDWLDHLAALNLDCLEMMWTSLDHSPIDFESKAGKLLSNTIWQINGWLIA